jgi:hypothetical protein
LTDQQIKHMVDRFLGWRLPDNFAPDAGISFKRTFNEHTPHLMYHDPHGTNLFDATQAEAMVRHMLEGLPKPEAGRGEAEVDRIAKLICGHAAVDECNDAESYFAAATHHSGDCTKECHTCILCRVELFRDLARQVIAAHAAERDCAVMAERAIADRLIEQLRAALAPAGHVVVPVEDVAKLVCNAIGERLGLAYESPHGLAFNFPSRPVMVGLLAKAVMDALAASPAPAIAAQGDAVAEEREACVAFVRNFYKDGPALGRAIAQGIAMALERARSAQPRSEGAQ